MANSVLAKMAVQISANTAEFNKALAKTNKDITSFTGGITKAAGVLGLAFGGQQIASFAIDVAKLAGEAEAVGNAFARLENSKALMAELKEATGGTVSELELMKRAVQASNFDISLKALPQLLEFATLRAQQTGQSVDYLVDSIVTGIGRKSKLILDNLGISATQLSKEFNGASLEAQNVADVTEAVGRIAERNLKNMEKFSQNTATSMQQLTASWEDLKVAIGKIVNQSGISKFVQEMASVAKFFAGDFTLTAVQVEKTIIELNKLREAAKLEGNQEDVKRFTKMIADLTSQYNLLKDKAIETTVAITKQTRTLDSLIAEKKELDDQFQTTDVNDRKEISNIGQKIIALDAQIKKLNELRTAQRKDANLKLQFIVPELSGDNANTKAANDFKDFQNGLLDVELQADSTKIALDGVSDSISGPLKKAMKEIIDIGPMIASSISDIAFAMGSGAENIGQAFLRNVSNFMRQLGAQMIAIGVGKVLLSKLATIPGPALIAGGIALTIAAGAIGRTLDKGISGSGSGGATGGGGRFSGVYAPVQSGTAQNTFSAETVIRGQDLYVVLQNHLNNNKSTRG